MSAPNSPVWTATWLSRKSITNWLYSVIAVSGRARLYNVASGQNVSNGALAETLASLGIACHFEPNAPAMRFSLLSVERLAREFGHAPQSVLAALPALLAASPED